MSRESLEKQVAWLSIPFGRLCGALVFSFVWEKFKTWNDPSIAFRPTPSGDSLNNAIDTQAPFSYTYRKKQDPGYVGRSPPADLKAAADVILAVAGMVENDPSSIIELDINPLMLMAEGQGVIAADALIRLNPNPKP